MGRRSSHINPVTQQPMNLAFPGMEDAGLSPIRRQYVELKRQRPDAILLFRLGDFYEAFEDDAHLIAQVLDITLTAREMGRGERLPMAGIPAHAAQAHIARLIAAGHHVAIAEQVGPLNRIGPAEALLAEGDAVLSRLLSPGAQVTRRGPDWFSPRLAERALVGTF